MPRPVPLFDGSREHHYKGTQMKRTMLLGILSLGLAGLQAPAQADIVYATGVVSFTQGLRQDLSVVPAPRTNWSNALGPVSQLPLNTGEERFVSLGFGGSIELSVGGTIQNGPGNDFVVYETTN